MLKFTLNRARQTDIEMGHGSYCPHPQSCSVARLEQYMELAHCGLSYVHRVVSAIPESVREMILVRFAPAQMCFTRGCLVKSLSVVLCLDLGGLVFRP